MTIVATSCLWNGLLVSMSSPVVPSAVDPLLNGPIFGIGDEVVRGMVCLTEGTEPADVTNLTS